MKNNLETFEEKIKRISESNSNINLYKAHRNLYDINFRQFYDLLALKTGIDNYKDLAIYLTKGLDRPQSTFQFNVYNLHYNSRKDKTLEFYSYSLFEVLVTSLATWNNHNNYQRSNYQNSKSHYLSKLTEMKTELEKIAD